jgi:NAD(P)-dependent dehydrogenase (short-subunit alcohol dehydrogenase family)
MALGFETTTHDVIAGVDLTGTTAIVTGASTGIGVETARALAAAGAGVVLAARNAERTEEAAASIRDRVPSAQLEVGPLDLTSLDSVRGFGAWYAESHDDLNLLVNNAGVMYTPFEHTADGFELQFGTNHLGHFLLTCLLVPALVAGSERPRAGYADGQRATQFGAAPSRVVNVTSAGHMASDVIWDDPNFERHPYDKFVAYGQSKTANILFAVELERRLGARGVHAYAVHPGRIATELGRYMTADDLAALRERAARGPSGGMPPRKTLEQGAATTVWAAVALELVDQGGTYLADCQVTDQHAPWALDPDGASRLWTLSEGLVGETFSFD